MPRPVDVMEAACAELAQVIGWHTPPDICDPFVVDVALDVLDREHADHPRRAHLHAVLDAPATVR